VIDTEVDGDVEAIRASATWLRGTLRQTVRDAADDTAGARTQAGRAWEGDDSDAYRSYARSLVLATDDHAERVGRAAQAFDSYATRLGALKRRMGEIRTEAREGGLTVSGKVIEEPAPAQAVPPLPPDATPQEALAHDQRVTSHTVQVGRIELYDKLADDADTEWTTFTDWCDTELAADVTDARDTPDLDALKGFVQDNLGNFLAGAGITFTAGTLLQRAGDYQARADELRAARRSGNPARRARGNAPDARTNVRAWTETADGLRRFSRFLGPVGIAVDVGFGIWDVSQGGSPGRATATTVASIAGGAAVVAGAGALAAAGIVTAPVWGTALAAGAVAVGAGWLAGEAWDALPDDFTDGVDDAISDTWEGATDLASEGWDEVTSWF
jgi:uncharacterized protein YukE